MLPCVPLPILKMRVIHDVAMHNVGENDKMKVAEGDQVSKIYLVGVVAVLGIGDSLRAAFPGTLLES